LVTGCVRQALKALLKVSLPETRKRDYVLREIGEHLPKLSPRAVKVLRVTFGILVKLSSAN
jgi:hypothetical protein